MKCCFIHWREYCVMRIEEGRDRKQLTPEKGT